MILILQIRRFFVSLLFFAGCFTSFSQSYKNAIYTPSIKTLTICKDRNWSSLPILNLGAENVIHLSFDEMSHDYHRLSYRIIHCNSDWKKSDLATPEFMNGLPENDFEDGIQSVGTYTPYTHYALQLPNPNVQLLVSGNYVVEVFDKYKPKELLLTACFSVLEQKVRINATVTATTDVDYKKEHQQLDLNLSPIGLTIAQPLQELQLVVQQNHSRDQEVRAIKPDNIVGDNLIFEHNAKLIFKGGNEFRRFETTTHKYAGLNINRIEYFKPYYNAELLPATKRSNGYLFDKDQNGRFVVTSQEAQHAATGADYFLVHFSFPMDEPFLDGAMHLYGDFVLNNLDETSKMSYNFEHKAYEKALLLKQGSYNYRYALKKTGSSFANSQPIEGSYWETENEYQIYVYYRPFGSRYDKLIGYKQLQTNF